MVVFREKSYADVKTAQRRTSNIIRRDKLFLAAMPWGPVIDGVYLKEQPYDMSINGKYDTTKKVMVGQTQHETEIYVR